MSKKSWFIVSASVLAILAAVFLFFFLYTDRPVEVNNVASLEDIISKKYSNKEIQMIPPLFRVYGSSGEMTAKQLAQKADVCLECKREVDSDAFYYVVQSVDGINCFIFTDAADVVQDVLITVSLPDTAQMQQVVQDYQFGGWELPTLGDTDCLLLEEGNQLVGEYLLYDGVLIVKWLHPPFPSKVTYEYYTDEQWAEKRAELGGYTILKMDRPHY